MRKFKNTSLFLLLFIALFLCNTKCNNPGAAEENAIVCTKNCPQNLVDNIKILCPNGGETYYVGDTIEVKWCYPTNMRRTHDLFIYISLDSGTNFTCLNLIEPRILYPQNSSELSIKKEYISNSCIVRITDFGDSYIEDSDATFSIKKP